MQQHIQSHRPAKRARGRSRKTAESITRAQAGTKLRRRKFIASAFVSGPRSRFFRVAAPKDPYADWVDSICAQVYEQIRQCEQKEERSSQIITNLSDGGV